MRKMKLSTITIRLMSMLAIAAMFVVSGCGDDDDGGDPDPANNVWQVVQNDSRLSSLEAELEAADLDGTLATTDNITLFAPSDQALETLLGVLGIEDFSTVRSQVVQAVLTYHVTNSVIMSSDLTSGDEIATLSNGEVITVVDGPALSTGATTDAEFVETDIEASNGVVHIVDYVLVPPSLGTVIGEVLGTLAQPIVLGESFSTLYAAIQKADAYAEGEDMPLLYDILRDNAMPDTDFTVFAPTNEVFVAAEIGLDDLTGEQWYGTIAKHVGIGIYNAEDLTTGTMITTAASTTLEVTNAGEGGDFTSIFLDSDGEEGFEAEVAQPAVYSASNGVLHAIAGIL